MSTETIPERGAPALPEGWPTIVHTGPAFEEGAVPGYLLDRGPVPDDPVGHDLTVEYGGEGDLKVVCDVAVIGSGAGGASLAKELAEHGLDVVVIEEGDLFTRTDFAGPPIERFMKMCRSGGATSSFGKLNIPIPIGRTVGGTTTVNSGTCFRAPRRVLSQWVSASRIEDIDYESIDPYYRKVEKIVNVRPVPWELLGPNGWLTHFGAQALGKTGGPILRNITSCHGSGQCAFGCPTDAKQAMHLSYLPRAQKAGARVFARARADWVTMERGRASGVAARFLGPRGEHLGNLRLLSKAVAVACGAIGTPVFLLKNRIANSSGQVGRNLSIHPATGVGAWFSDPIYGWRGTLQPYYVDSLFAEKGVMLEATNTVPSVGGSVFPGYGLPIKEILANFAHFATLGFLVADTSRGRVRRAPGDEPFITYSLNRVDAANIFEGMALSAEILLAAGAFSVTPGLPGLESVIDSAGVDEIRKGRWSKSALKLSAYHPAGTARMGRDPSRSVVDGNLETHDVSGLYVTDASVFPSCPGVNPQLTIMALATRAAEAIASRLL